MVRSDFVLTDDPVAMVSSSAESHSTLSLTCRASHRGKVGRGCPNLLLVESLMDVSSCFLLAHDLGTQSSCVRIFREDIIAAKLRWQSRLTIRLLLIFELSLFNFETKLAQIRLDFLSFNGIRSHTVVYIRVIFAFRIARVVPLG